MCLQKKEQNKKGKKKEDYVMKKYDYLIVGAGLFGAVFAHEAKEAGKTCPTEILEAIASINAEGRPIWIPIR